MTDWTPAAERLLQKFFSEGRTGLEIAKILTRKFETEFTRSAVIGKKWRMDNPGLSNARRKRAASSQKRGLDARIDKRGTATSVHTKTHHSAPLPKEPLSTGATKSMMDLKNCDCRWPFGDPRASDFGFCGEMADAGSSYCPEHRAISRRRTYPNKIETPE